MYLLRDACHACAPSHHSTHTYTSTLAAHTRGHQFSRATAADRQHAQSRRPHDQGHRDRHPRHPPQGGRDEDEVQRHGLLSRGGERQARGDRDGQGHRDLRRGRGEGLQQCDGERCFYEGRALRFRGPGRLRGHQGDERPPAPPPPGSESRQAHHRRPLPRRRGHRARRPGAGGGGAQGGQRRAQAREQVRQCADDGWILGF